MISAPSQENNYLKNHEEIKKISVAVILSIKVKWNYIYGEALYDMTETKGNL